MKTPPRNLPENLTEQDRDRVFVLSFLNRYAITNVAGRKARFTVEEYIQYCREYSKSTRIDNDENFAQAFRELYSTLEEFRMRYNL